MQVSRENARADRIARLIKRFGVAGFLFFLIKGLAWLIIPGLLAGGLFYR